MQLCELHATGVGVAVMSQMAQLPDFEKQRETHAEFSEHKSAKHWKD